MRFKPQNELEKALSAAVEDPSRRREFYEELQHSELYTLHMDGEAKTENGRLPEHTAIRLPSLEVAGSLYLPVFSSLKMLQQFLDCEMQYVSMNAMDLFRRVQGSDVWLNPGGEFAKSFSAAEIESILDGSLLGPPSSYTLDPETAIILGNPDSEPNDLLNELTEIFLGLPNVKLAYHAHHFNPKTGEPPHTLIAVQADGDWNEVVRAAGSRPSASRVSASRASDPPVDFLRLDGRSGLDAYFEAEGEPFYRKRSRSKLFVR
ncbi:enhanced serine sensitivity protein SseB C-terminal domain-containing protein [Saccharibacillus qingshengii]|uniref:enhanced serine sensitivity protein SseB C-terminal domain-containing protein n=1 Tax=Saccharibacillus qingshengii TaxID=1763540 RepID=UPI00155262B6|nr:enhanced serine sensitivity protein SseB C-terminal domain-containing protein [Saccharibacillus qingshengii]